MLINKIINKSHAELFDLRMKIHGKMGLPVQTGKERRIFKTLFDSMGDTHRDLNIFEWGSGLSTIYYAKYLTGKKIKFNWHAIDNNETWYDKVHAVLRQKNLHQNVCLHLKPFDPFWEKPGWGSVPPPRGEFSPKTQNEWAYIDYPKTMGMKFDIMIVDARFRRHCIQTAKECLDKEGIVIMHDAQKPHYQIGVEAYPFRGFIRSGFWTPLQREQNKIWVGAKTNTGIFNQLMSI